MSITRNAAKGSLLVATILALGACTGPEIAVREIASPVSQADLSVTDRLGEAAAQMRMGNVGLAIESYRKALRKSPRSALAHAGIAAAYDRMGRFDLSLDHYQVALAIQPEDPRLYGALAGSLRAQGRPMDAARVMAEGRARQMQAQEIDTLAVAEAPPGSPVPRTPVAFLGPPSAPELVAGSINVLPTPLDADAMIGAVTVRLPEAEPRHYDRPDLPGVVTRRAGADIRAPAGELAIVDLVTIASDAPRVLPAGKAARPELAAQRVALVPGVVPVVQLDTVSAEAPSYETRLERAAVPAPTLHAAPLRMKSVRLRAPAPATLAPPPQAVPVAPAPKYAFAARPVPVVSPRPAGLVREVTDLEAPDGATLLIEAPRARGSAATPPVAPKPLRARLERLTSGEVALVTTNKPVWERRPAYRTRVVEKTPTATTVQFTRAAREPAPVMLIAAGASVRLAEAARTQLAPEGVKVVETTRSPTARARSVLFFPKGREEDAKALVARFGFRIAAQVGPVDVMTLHLGADANAALLGG